MINKKLRKFDLVFVTLHGAEGEMGYLQRNFETELTIQAQMRRL